MQYDKEKGIISLKGLSELISVCIKRNFPEAIWIRAEMSKLHHYPKSGHCYPDLVEKDHGRITAQQKATMWSGDYQRIRNKFLSISGEELSDGMDLLLLIKVDYHPIYGFSLNIKDIDPSYTLGKLAKEKKLCIEKIKNSGLFEANKKIKIPIILQKLAIISDESSKGFHDFINIITRQANNYDIQLTLFPSLLQGDSAVKTIKQALTEIRKRASEFDVVAIVRGGGADTGLSCYDNYELASEIAAFPLPVFTGIGHSTNETVVEMLAAKNLITPTELAYVILNTFSLAEKGIHSLAERLSTGSKEFTHEFQTQIENICDKLIQLTNKRTQEAFKILNHDSHKLYHTSLMISSKEKWKLRHFYNRLEKGGLQQIAHNNEELKRSKLIIIEKTGQRLNDRKLSLEALREKTKLLSPENILKRGYSITYYKGLSLKSSKDVAVGESISTRLASGSIDSTITKTNQKEMEDE